MNQNKNKLNDNLEYEFGPDVPGLNVMYDIIKSGARIVADDIPYELKPVNDKIVVRPTKEEDEHITESGLILPDCTS